MSRDPRPTGQISSHPHARIIRSNLGNSRTSAAREGSSLPSAPIETVWKYESLCTESCTDSKECIKSTGSTVCLVCIGSALEIHPLATYPSYLRFMFFYSFVSFDFWFLNEE